MIRVLVVDDSSVVRRLVASALRADPEFEVAGFAVDGEEAVERVAELQPDAVTLDVEMPRVDGLEALRRIRSRWPRLPVVMLSTLTERGARVTLDALSLGASDYVPKPQGADSVQDAVGELGDQLRPRLRALVGVRRMLQDPAARPAPRPRPTVPAGTPTATPGPRPAGAPPLRPELLVVGCSTGGPDALSQVLTALPGSLRTPVLVVQHMPPVFTTMFAERLDRVSGFEVREATDGEVVGPGQVRIGPGDWHLTVEDSPEGLRTRLDQEPPENFCRPAVDVLFRSAAVARGGHVLGLVLTGMGHDGLSGARALTAAGGAVLVQDQETSVVWGMPGAVAEAGLAAEVLPLPALADEVLRRTGR